MTALSLPPAALLRPITGEEIRVYERDGVVHLPGIIDRAWAALLAEGIDELLAEPIATTMDLTAIGQLADQHLHAAASGVAGKTIVEANTEWAIAERLGDTVLRDETLHVPEGREGRFVSVHQIAWKLNPKIRALVIDSPCPEIAAVLMRSRRVNFYQEQVLVKTPLTKEKTAWHQDQGYDHCAGEQLCGVRVVCDPESLENGTVLYWRGSHLSGTVYKVNFFVSDQTNEGDPGADLPTIDGHESDFDLVHFNPRPGDVIVHHLRSVHGSGANRSARQTRRAITIRYGGDDAVYKLRRFAPPDGIEIEREDGQPLERYAQEYPRVWPRATS